MSIWCLNKSEKEIKDETETILLECVRILIDNPLGCALQCRTALVSRELERYSINVAALSETRLTGDGQLQEFGGGCADRQSALGRIE